MVKVLQVFGSLNMGGAECRMMEVYRNIDRKEFPFDFLILSSGEQFFEKEILLLGGKIYKLKMPTPWMILYHIHELMRILRDGRYDVVHAHTSYHCGLVMYAARRVGIPVRIAHARTTGSKRAGCIKSLMTSIGKILADKFATHRLAISQSAGEYLFSNHEFEVLPNAIDVGKFLKVSPEEVTIQREKFQIPENALVIGQIGRFEAMKNHAFTLHWFKQFHQICNQTVLILVGDGSKRHEMEELADTLGLREAVRFTGVVGEVEKLLRTFHVLFFPSLFEGLGGVVLEAQAAGVPAVISDTLPFETDLELGLVKRCGLQEDMSVWNQAVQSCRNMKIPSSEMIRQAFFKHGYSLEYELQRLGEIYSSGRKNV